MSASTLFPQQSIIDRHPWDSAKKPKLLVIITRPHPIIIIKHRLLLVLLKKECHLVLGENKSKQSSLFLKYKHLDLVLMKIFWRIHLRIIQWEVEMDSLIFLLKVMSQGLGNVCYIIFQMNLIRILWREDIVILTRKTLKISQFHLSTRREKINLVNLKLVLENTKSDTIQLESSF